MQAEEDGVACAEMIAGKVGLLFSPSSSFLGLQLVKPWACGSCHCLKTYQVLDPKSKS